MNSTRLGPSGGKVLVVDDDEAVLTLLLNIFEGAGYDVWTAQDGAKALRMLQTQPFDVMLLDLVMPNRDGIEVLRDIRERQPSLKVVAMSGAFGGNMLGPAKLMGAQATVLKPFSPTQPLATVHKVLRA